MLSTLLLSTIGVGCGENVLVGNLQLLSLSDAGPDEVDAVEVDAVEADAVEVDTIEIDAGPGRQARNAQRARDHADEKSEQKSDQNNEQDGDHDDRSNDKGH